MDMKQALLISDTHLEYEDDKGKAFLASIPKDGVDILIAAGDICGYSQIESTLKRLCNSFPQVVYLYGNHECWHSSIQSVSEKCARLESQISNLSVLDCGKRVVDNVEFVGATMWFAEHPLTSRLHRWLNDFELIRSFAQDYSEQSWDVFSQNKKAEDFLRENVTRKSAVVTHHLPHEVSVSPRFKGDETNIFFLHDMSDLIISATPQFWGHGHTHDSCDYRIRGTRIVCNPRGYPFEGNPMFTWKFIDLKEIDEF